MKFEDIILENLLSEEKEEEIILNEDIFPITPFLAYASFKKSTFGALKDKMIDAKTKVGDWARKQKADALIKREKARAGLGISSGEKDDATVYKLTNQQLNVMADIYKRHGKKIINDILEFRKNVLAPYSLIKRKVKEASRVTNKDKFGMTKAEFKAYLESGRRKIENRGEKFSEKSEDLRDRLSRITEQIDLLKKAESRLGEEKAEFPRSILNRLYKDYKVHDADLLGFSPEELRQAENKIEAEKKEMDDLLSRFKEGESNLEDIDKAIELATRKEISIFKKDQEKPVVINQKNNFNIAIARYLFRKEILDDLREPQASRIKQVFSKIVSEMIIDLNERRKDTVRKLSSLNNSINFNEKEALIWKVRPTASSSSGNLNDYYQALKEEDFLDAPIYIERSPELKEAEQKIENEIKRFERSLEKKIGKEDFTKLKQYRLINNLITVRELKSTTDLFKDTDELIQTTDATRQDIEYSRDFISPEDFERRIWSIHGYTFSSIAELNNAKQEVENLIKTMQKQGDTQVVKKLSNIIERIRIRRTLEPQRHSFVGQEGIVAIGIDQITKKAEEMVNAQYDNTDDVRRDKERLDDMISKFRENKGADADRELLRIKFLLDKVERKLSWGF